jgi:hypothetical protein
MSREVDLDYLEGIGIKYGEEVKRVGIKVLVGIVPCK